MGVKAAWGLTCAMRQFGALSVRELLRSADLVFVSFVEAILAAEGIEPVVLDQHMGAAHTNIAAFPRRIMVDDDDVLRARALLKDAGYGAELSKP
jgi:hypothetical protein